MSLSIIIINNKVLFQWLDGTTNEVPTTNEWSATYSAVVNTLWDGWKMFEFACLLVWVARIL